MPFSTLLDGVDRTHITLANRLPVTVLHHRASGVQARPDYALRFILPWGVRHDHHTRMGTTALHAQMLGTDYAQRKLLSYPGTSAELTYETTEVEVRGEDLKDVVRELTLRLRILPQEAEMEPAWRSVLAEVERGRQDPALVVANHAHAISFDSIVSLGRPWPAGSRPHVTLRMPTFDAVKVAWRRVNPYRGARLIVASNRPVEEVAAYLQTSPLAEWTKADSARRQLRTARIRAPPLIQPAIRRDVRFPDGRRGYVAGIVIVARGSDFAPSTLCDLLRRIPGCPLKVDYWRHREATLIALWELLDLDEGGAARDVVLSALTFLKPIYLRDGAARGGILLARHTYDLTLRETKRNPALLAAAVGKAEAPFAPPMVSASPNTAPMLRALASLLETAYWIRPFITRPLKGNLSFPGFNFAVNLPARMW